MSRTTDNIQARVKPFVNSTIRKAVLTMSDSVETKAPTPSALPMLVVSTTASQVPTAPIMVMSGCAAAWLGRTTSNNMALVASTN